MVKNRPREIIIKCRCQPQTVVSQVVDQGKVGCEKNSGTNQHGVADGFGRSRTNVDTVPDIGKIGNEGTKDHPSPVFKGSLDHFPLIRESCKDKISKEQKAHRENESDRAVPR